MDSVCESSNALVDNFFKSSFVIPVVEVGSQKQGMLTISDEYSEKMNLLKQFAKTTVASMGQPHRFDDMVDGLLKSKISYDLWYLSIKGGSTIILVKEDVYKKINEKEIVSQVHKEEIESAAQRGESVPEDLLRYYKGKSRNIYSPSSMN